MQTISPAVKADLDKTSVSVFPEAIFEFDHNLLVGATVNSPDSLDEELFPKESVLEQSFVNSGLPKAIVGNAVAYNQSNNVQYRVVSEDDVYKYWVSPTLSEPTFISNAWMEVVYDQTVSSNLVEVVFEVSYAQPNSVNLLVRQAGQWLSILSAASPDSDGVLRMYATADSWTQVGPGDVNNFHQIDGVRVEVNSMSASGVRAQITSLSAKWRVDMSERITQISIGKTMDNPTISSPIGDSSTNEASLSLENEDGAFNPNDATATYRALMSRNVRVETRAKVANHEERIPQGIFYTNSWATSAPGIEVQTECSDVTRFMQETFVPPFLLRDYRVTDAVREILQRAGFNIDQITVQEDPVIPFVWYNEQVSVWEALKDLANATLSYFYINENDDFIWTDFASLSSKPHSQTLDATDDIIDFTPQFDILSNSVNIEYNKYGLPKDVVSKEIINQELWLSSEDVALLSHPIASTIETVDDYIELDVGSALMDLWPDTGIVAVQGEYMRYSGKDKALRRLTGLQRGLWGSKAQQHITPHLGLRTSVGTRGRQQVVSKGNLLLVNPSRAAWSHYTYSHFGDSTSAHKVYGTSLRIWDRGAATGGLVINRAGSQGGFYLEITTSRVAQSRNIPEIRVYRRDSSTGSLTVMAVQPYTVAPGAWYDLDITVNYTTPEPQYAFYVNGMFIGSVHATFQPANENQGTFGPYIKGGSSVEFSRIYTSDGNNANTTPASFQDTSSGSSFSSGHIFNLDSASLWVNEFAPQVRQVQKFEVDYSVYPAISASIISTNYWQTRALRFTPGPFGATFYLENKSDETAVASGTSPNLFEDDMNMTLMIHGLPVIVSSEERKTVKDKLSIKKYGLVELEVSNPWIQTDSMAQNMANLITEHFGSPVDVVDADVVADLTIQLGDIVDIDFMEYGYTPETHHYYVIGINTDWNDGFGQKLILRRKP